MRAMQRTANNLADVKETESRSWFDQLPEAIRKQSCKLWMCRRHLNGMDSPASLVANLMFWVCDCGLSEENAIDILEAVMKPGQMAGMQFASQLLSAMDALVAEKLKDQSSEHWRKELEAEKHQPRVISGGSVK